MIDIKVLQINSVCGIGSTGRIAADLYRLLKIRGDSAKVAFGRKEARGVAQEDLIRIGSENGVKLHALRARLTDRTGFYSAAATRKLIEAIGAYNPDVIHLHNLHGYYLHLGILFDYLKSTGKPVVWTLHDCWAFTGHCAYFDFVGCEKWKTGCRSCGQKSGYPASMAADASAKNYEDKKRLFTALDNLTLVTPSHWLADLTRDSFLSGYPAEVIPNGIDLSVFQPLGDGWKQQNGLEGKKLILGVADVWSQRKGMADMLALAGRLGTSRYKMVLVGVSAHQLRALPPDVIGVLHTSSVEELARIYSAADVFVNPTLEDNFPTTNLEALACGTPVVTYQTGGSPECLDDSCGIVVEKRDIDALQRAVESICDNPPAPEQCQKRAQLYDKERRFSQYLALYDRLAGKEGDEA